MEKTPRYPNVEVELSNTDGNAFRIIGSVKRALQAAKVPEQEIGIFMTEAMASDYDHLLSTAQDWVYVT